MCRGVDGASDRGAGSEDGVALDGEVLGELLVGFDCVRKFF